MPGLLGSSRAQSADVAELAKKLMHTDDQQIVELAVRGDFAAAQVAAATAVPRPAQAAPHTDVLALVHGEILQCDQPNPEPARSAAFLRDAYTRDPSCAFLERASGVFCGVVVDGPRRRVLLVSDPFGFGHIYYGLGAQRELLFATEQKCFTGFRGSWEVRPDAVEEFLREDGLCGTTTWLKGVELLAPGHYALYDLESQRLSTVRYCDPTRMTRDPFDSYQEAKQELIRALGQAFALATRDAKRWAVQLNGDFSSRMLLASGNAAGLDMVGVTAADDETEDLTYARRACGARNTIHFSSRMLGEDWLLKRAHLAWMADGANLLRLSLASVVPTLRSRNSLSGFLGDLLLGAAGINGYDDVRLAQLSSGSRRAFGSRLRVWDNFCRQRFPFADPGLIATALRADVAYLLDARLRADIALSAFPDYFTNIPVRGTGGRLAGQILNGEPVAPVRAKKRNLTPYEECVSQLRSDPKLEAFVWDLLAGKNALHRSFTDQKAADAAFWSFFRGGENEDREALVRYVSLEVWLRQLLRAELISAPAPAPRRVEARDPAVQVSVIVPAYNVEPYIGECLNSLTNQDLREIEVLVVDDGSTDGTPDALRRFAQDPRVRTITTANAGVYHARNRALEVARGRDDAVVDSADYVHASMLQKLVEAADRHGADVTFCDVVQFDSDGELKVRGNTLGFRADAPLNLTNTPEMISDGFTTLWNRLYSRDFLERHELRFDERFRISADMLFLQEVLLHASTLVRVPKSLYYYRFATPNSLTSYEVRNAQYRTHLQITIELIDFWVRNKQFDRHAPMILTKAMRNFLWNTHIDVQKLATVFDELHRYVRKLRIGPVQYNKIEPFERHVLQLLRSGDFAAFMRYVRPYRIKMVLSKGGELTRAERFTHGLDVLKGKLTRSLDLQIEKNPAKKRYKLVWPRARLDVTLNFNAAPSAAQVGDIDIAPARPAAAATKTIASLQAIRNGVLLRSDVQNALHAEKRGASRRVLHFSNAFSLPSETFTYDVLTGLERDPRLDNYMMFFTRELPRERPFEKTIQLYGGSRAALDNGQREVAESIDLVLDALMPDLVHCHFGWVGIPLVRLLAERQRPLPVVITMHGTDVNMWPARFPWYRDALKHLHRYPWVSFTTHTETYRRKLAALGVPASRIDVIPNSFDPRFAEGREGSLYESGGEFRVISVARMDIWKGQEYLIRGFAKFQRTCYANASLSLVGYGTQERALRALVDELGIQEQVRFYGRVVHQEVPVLLRNHDVYVQASIKHPETLQEEGQPIALLEAIACGVRVIITDTGAMAETVRVGNYAGSAFVIPDKNCDAIAEALENARRTPPSEHARRAYVRAICEKHKQDDQLRRTLQVYERAWSASTGQVSAAVGSTLMTPGLEVVDGTR